MSDILITYQDGSQALAHFGVKGMHWGVWNEETRQRRAGGKAQRYLRKAEEQRAIAAKASQVRTVSSQKAMTASRNQVALNNKADRAASGGLFRAPNEAKADRLAYKADKAGAQYQRESAKYDEATRKMNKANAKAEKYENKAVNAVHKKTVREGGVDNLRADLGRNALGSSVTGVAGGAGAGIAAASLQSIGIGAATLNPVAAAAIVGLSMTALHASARNRQSYKAGKEATRAVLRQHMKVHEAEEYEKKVLSRI